ncbi:MAG: sulfite dehydrogenase [Pseudomonadota bacterium]|nr:sulfite dehydrogenase [Pseudomonadota bacterium]
MKSLRASVVPAQENHLPPAQLFHARRNFVRRGLAAGAVAASGGAIAQPASDASLVPPWTRSLGAPVAATGYGLPSKHEANVQRRQSPGLTPQPQASISFTPLQNLFGIITPSGVHFERHHSGMPAVDPEQHRLMVHGLVKRPLMLTMDDVMRFPSLSRIHFIECGANGGMEWANVAVPTVQYTHGMIACSEFTGVLLSTLLDEVGFDRTNGKFVLAEGADGSALTRTIPIEFALNDAMVVYGQNGEMLRPENGYPLRLLVPGVQGVSSVKWLRRLEVGDKPWNTREESLHYIDLLPDGTHRQYSGVQEVKSVITTPSGGQKLVGKGYHQISGLAWSGRGKVTRVDVSIDGGRNWQTARLQEPVLTKALTRFRFDWSWDGAPALLQSRAVDETGHVQPTLNQLRAVRGVRSIYHNNGVQTWRVQPDGEVWNVQLA